MKNKLLRQFIMLSKLTFYGIFFQCLFAGIIIAADLEAQKIKTVHDVSIQLDGKEQKISDLFKLIELNSDFQFTYYQGDFDEDQVIKTNRKKLPISEVLLQISKEANLIFRQVNNNINVKRITIENVGNPIQVIIQGHTITGKVISSEDDQGLPGTNVILKGTVEGTVTDIEGNFSIDVPNGDAILVFSSVGFITEEIQVGDQTVIDVSMIPDITALEEIVVIGYGTAKKSDVTGSMVSLGQDDIMANQPVTINQALQGKAPGVMIVSGDDPGATSKIRIRGNRSMTASNEPLYVVDGIPTVNTIDDINPADIESIEVLKDASATAIYGARGANGVILISTKRGGEGPATISYNGNISIGTIYRNLELFDGAEYAEYVREAYRNSTSVANKYNSATPSWEEDQLNPRFASDRYVLESLRQAYDANGNYDPSKVRSYDWRSLGLDDFSVRNQHALSINGGTKDTKVFVSTGINTNDGIMVGNRYDRYTVRGNIDQKIQNIFTIGVQSSFSYSKSTEGYRSLYTDAAAMSPLANPYQDGEEEGFTEHPGGDPLLYNPVRVIGNYDQEIEGTQTFVNLYASIDILESLNFKTTYGINIRNQNEGSFSGEAYTTALNSASSSEERGRMWTLENLLTYNKTFGVHTISANLLQSAQQSILKGSSISAEDMPYETQLWYDLGSASKRTVSSDYSQWNLMSYMGRINYNYDDKYLFTGSIRYDGSSRLAPEHKWVAFPSLALAWRINQEEFLKDSEFLSDLKLRIGWGKTGNSAITPYQTLGTVSLTRYGWDKDIEGIGYYASAISNTELTWETTKQINVGLDFGIVNGKISGSIDLYRQNTTDLLNYRSLPSVSGFQNIITNIGETQNTGIEVALNTVNVNSKDWRWATDFSFSYNKEEIVSLGYTDGDDVGNQWFIGYPANIYYDYVFDGVWGTSTEDQAELTKFNDNGASFQAGDPKVKDLNGDYIIDGNNDREILGQTYPNYNIGFTSNLKYKNWDLYLFAYGVFGGMTMYDIGVGYDGRYNSVKYQYWTEENQDTRYFRPQESKSDFAYENVSHYFSSDFVRINDITLGYTFQESLLNRFHIDKLRVYLKAHRPFLITNFVGNDPEAGVGDNVSDDDSYTLSLDSPSMRYFMFGIDLTF